MNASQQPEQEPLHLIVLSGRSGSGKTVALRQLEDKSFYCVDNLPTSLLPNLLQLTLYSEKSNLRKVAVAIDVRNLDFNMNTVVEHAQEIHERGKCQVDILYLDAPDNVLQRRFKETRRKHPLFSPDRIDVRQALQRENERLEPVRNAGLLLKKIDTASLTFNELRTRINEIVSRDTTDGFSLEFCSFGYKNGLPDDADLVFDVRCVSNPYWEESLRTKTGRDREVIEYLESREEVGNLYESTCAWLKQWLDCVAKENRSYVTVAIGCTGGLHRSVYFCERLAKHFRKTYTNVQVRHRDMPREQS